MQTLGCDLILGTADGGLRGHLTPCTGGPIDTVGRERGFCRTTLCVGHTNHVNPWLVRSFWEQIGHRYIPRGRRPHHLVCSPRVDFLGFVFRLWHWGLRIEPRGFHTELHPQPLSIFEIGSCNIPKLPRLASNLRSSCLGLRECWDHRMGPYTQLGWREEGRKGPGKEAVHSPTCDVSSCLGTSLPLYAVTTLAHVITVLKGGKGEPQRSHDPPQGPPPGSPQ